MKTFDDLKVGDEVYYIHFDDCDDLDFFTVKTLIISSTQNLKTKINITTENGYKFDIPKVEKNLYCFEQDFEDVFTDPKSFLFYNKKDFLDKLQNIKEEIIENNMLRLKEINKKIKKYQ